MKEIKQFEIVSLHVFLPISNEMWKQSRFKIDFIRQEILLWTLQPKQKREEAEKKIWQNWNNKQMIFANTQIAKESNEEAIGRCSVLCTRYAHSIDSKKCIFYDFASRYRKPSIRNNKHAESVKSIFFFLSFSFCLWLYSIARQTESSMYK